MSHPRLALVLAVATAATAGAAPAAHGDDHDLGHWRPDAEMFATSNTSVITDPDDPRLDRRLTAFSRKVRRFIAEGGGVPRGSTLLDGVFFSSVLGTTTFERSRDFDIDGVTTRELGVIAERVRRHFKQQSVLTFDYLPALSPKVDAIEIEVPGVDAQSLRDALLADRVALEKLSGGSVTFDERLLLVADVADFTLVRDLVQRIGGDWKAGRVRFGDREFVS
jgi:hypothetical protein